jgi:hypothetical protein
MIEKFVKVIKSLITLKFQIAATKKCLSEKSVWLVLQILYFRLQVIYKSYRQVLTPVNNSQHLLKLENLDKLRLVTFHQWQHKESVLL